MTALTACFVSASGQNAYFGELLDALREALEGLDVSTEVAVDHFPTVREGLTYVFVPHEYLSLTLKEVHPGPEQVRRSVAVLTEQPGTPWFAKAAKAAARAAAAVEIHPSAIAALEREGVAARQMPFGYVPNWDRWGGEATAERAFDYTFLGQYTPRRAQILAQGAAHLHRRRGYVGLAHSSVPNSADSSNFLTGERKWEHLASSATLLNIHRDEYPYFEWVRVAEAIANGCVVVSEHSLGFEPLVPGEHFVSASPERLPLVLASLLGDDRRLEALRQAAYDKLRRELPLSRSIEVLANALEDVRSAANTGPSPAAPGRCDPQPRPRPRRSRVPKYVEVSRSHAKENDPAMMRMALKQLLVGQRQLSRRLDDLERGDAVGEQATVHTRGPYDAARPRVSVATTVFNYEGYVGEAIRSVALSDLREVEIVVVDDASTDGSGGAIDEALGAHPWLPAKVVSLARNGGLPRARNVAFEHARGDYVFVLDADNAVYPHALRRLAEALDDAPDAAFAYCLLAGFDAEGPRQILSWHAWEPDELRYGNFIDAMALVRRSAWEAVGGYVVDARLLGWEDFALWCSFAQHGLRGVRVPEPLARYRQSAYSMQSLTNIDTAEVWSLLLERYPFLKADGPLRDPQEGERVA